MKTYSLDNIANLEGAARELRRLLPGQEMPWLLKDTAGDVIAYFNVGPSEAGGSQLWVTVDISGRHFGEERSVVAVLRELQAVVGGIVRDDNDQAL